jgi:hypothetical protein
MLNTKSIMYMHELNCKKKQVNFYKGVRFASSINATLISFEDKTKYDCVVASMLSILHTYSSNQIDLLLCIQIANTSRFANKTYWVSGMSIGCPSAFRWCNYMDNPKLDLNVPYLAWQKSEPSSDPMKECLNFEFVTRPPYLLFSRTDCNSYYSYITEGNETEIN